MLSQFPLSGATISGFISISARAEPIGISAYAAIGMPLASGFASNAPIIAIATIMRQSTVNLTAPLTDTMNVTANLL